MHHHSEDMFGIIETPSLEEGDADQPYKRCGTKRKEHPGHADRHRFLDFPDIFDPHELRHDMGLPKIPKSPADSSKENGEECERFGIRE